MPKHSAALHPHGTTPPIKAIKAAPTERRALLCESPAKPAGLAPQLKTQNSLLKTLRIQAIQGIQGSWDCFHWMLGVRCLSAAALAKVDWMLDVSPNCKYSLDAAAVGKQ